MKTYSAEVVRSGVTWRVTLVPLREVRVFEGDVEHEDVRWDRKRLTGPAGVDEEALRALSLALREATSGKIGP